jgi:arylsulfatase A-like enzyme
MMKKISTALAGMILLFSPLAAQQKKPVSILFIAVDDLRPDIGAYGNVMVRTPNIDRLARMGTVFMRNYCQQAVCGPTRASLMTGMRPDHTRIWDLKTQMRDMKPDIVTLPQYLIRQGYLTKGAGKIYHPTSAIKKIDPVSWNTPYVVAEPEDYALGKPAGNQYLKPENMALFDEKKNRKNTSQEDDETASTAKIGPSVESMDVPDDAYEDGVLALKMKQQIIEMSKAEKPFFAAIGFHKPHLPFIAPKKYWDLYDRQLMPLAAFQQHAKDGPEIAYHRSGELRNYPDIPPFVTFKGAGNHIGLAEAKQRELIHGYHAAISYTDAQIGILLNTLDSLGTLDNTIIVLWGDHGWHLGDHDLWNKHSNFEQATRSPLIIAAPGMKPGKATGISEHLDIFPTICDLASLPVPAQLQGRSLKPLMENKGSSVKTYAVSQYPRSLTKDEMKQAGYTRNKVMGYSMRTDRYRFTVWMHDYTSDRPFDPKLVYATELYDYRKDPLEKQNLAKDGRYRKTSKNLYEEMQAFFAANRGG